jgi:hypothetical protein
MSYGAMAGYADVIEEAHLDSVCGKENNNLHNAMDKIDITLNEVAQAKDWDMDLHEYLFDASENPLIVKHCEEHGDDPMPEITNILAALQDLYSSFNKRTGLDLELYYHDSDNGSPYDEVDGAYWAVGGVYVESSEYLKAKKALGIVVNRLFFTTHG